MRALLLLSAFVVWFAVCRLVPDRNAGTALFFLVPFMLTIVAYKVTQTDGGVDRGT